MSFHGAALGVIIAGWIFARRNGVDYFSTMDLCTAAVPIGLFGRLANFVNGELLGRVSTCRGPWCSRMPRIST